MPDTLTITREWFSMLESLPTVQSRWNVLYAVSRFAFDGVKPDGLNPIEKSVFMNMKNAILNRRRRLRNYRKNKENRYNVTLHSNGDGCELNHYNVTLHCNGVEEQELPLNIKEVNGSLKKDNTIDSSKDLKENWTKESPKQKRKIFVPPTLEQVREYAFERNSPADPEEFYSYHSANGWMIGRAKMVDWKKAFVYWERKEFNRARRRNSPPPRDYSGI